MSVTLRKRTNPADGTVRPYYFIDKTIKLPDGTTFRIREVPPDQTRRGAERYEADRVREVLDSWRAKSLGIGSVPKAPPCQTLKDFYPRFLREYVSTENKGSEHDSKVDIFENHLLPFFGAMRLDEIKAADIDRFKAEQLTKVTVRKTPMKKKTVNNQLTVLRKCLVQARDWEIISDIPIVRFFKKLPPPPFDFLTIEEANTLLELAKVEPEWHAMLVVALRAGLRRGELRALRWSDLDFERRIIHVRQTFRREKLGLPKGGKAREVEMTEEVARILQAHRHERGAYVFCKPDGEHFTEGETRCPLDRARKRAKLRHFMWHVLRHSFCSHLVMAGVSLRIVQALAGHTSYKMTERYAHLSPEVRGKAVRVLDRLGDGALGGTPLH